MKPDNIFQNKYVIRF